MLSAAAPRLRDGGAIVIISSVDSETPVSGLAHYCASKAGVEALSRSAALELGPRGIRCNVVAPGVVRTPLMAPYLDRPEVSHAFTSRTPLAGSARPTTSPTSSPSSSRRPPAGSPAPASRSTAASACVNTPRCCTEPERTSP